MKSKVVFFIIALVILLPISVKADIDCGKYVSSLTTSKKLEADVKIEGNTVKYRVLVTSFSMWSSVHGSASECPSIIYCVCGSSTCDIDVCYLSKKSNAYHTWTPKHIETPEPDVEIDASDKYKDIQSCKAATYKYIKQCGCMPAALTDLTSRLYMLIKIAAPALLLIVGGFDLVKAMSAQDEKAIKKAQQKLVKKFVAAAAVFLILTVVQFLVSTLSNNTKNTLECLDYLLNGYVA